MQKENQGKIQTYRSFAAICLISLNISLSFFYFGYTVIYYASIPAETVSKLYGIDQDQALAMGLLNGAVSVGGLIGSYLSSLLLSHFSRRNCLLLLDFCSIIAGILIFIPNFYTFLVFRGFQGICAGAFTSISPLIIKEITPLEVLGKMGSFSQLNLGFGVFFGQLLSYILKKWTGDESGEQFWVLVFGFSLITQIIQIIVLVFIFPYETPKYLLLNNEKKACEDLIRSIYKDEYFEQIYQQKIDDITHDKVFNPEVEINYSSTQSHEVVPLAAIVGVMLTCLQQLSGINAIILYTSEIAQKLFTGQIVLVIPMLANLLIFIFTIVSIVLLSNQGRRNLIVAGFALAGIANSMIALGQSSKDDSLSWVILIGVALYVMVYGASLGPIGWAYLPEIIPPSTMPYIVACNWISYGLVAFFFPIITEHLLGGNPCLLFLLFACLCLIGCLFNCKYMVQTKNKSDKAIMAEYKALRFC